MTTPSSQNRTASQKRKTAETSIEIAIDLDGSGATDIATGIPFFDHMLTLLGKHSLIDLTVEADGDIDVTHTTPWRTPASC